MESTPRNCIAFLKFLRTPDGNAKAQALVEKHKINNTVAMSTELEVMRLMDESEMDSIEVTAAEIAEFNRILGKEENPATIQ